MHRTNGTQAVFFFKRHESISVFISQTSDDERRVNSIDHDPSTLFRMIMTRKCLIQRHWRRHRPPHCHIYLDAGARTKRLEDMLTNMCVFARMERQVSHHHQHSSLSVHRTLHSLLNVWWRCQRSHDRTNQVSYTRLDHPDTIRMTARVQNTSSFTWSTRITCWCDVECNCNERNELKCTLRHGHNANTWN